MLQPLNVVFCGTPDFCLPSLELLINHPLINLVKVISQPSRASGRGHQVHAPAVIEFAEKHGINFFQTENINKEETLLEELKELKIDVMIVLAFSQFLSQKVLDLPRLGCFNIHGSLLPKYRGAAPIQYALLHGDEVTGISIQKMVKKMDAGDVLQDDELPIFSPYEDGGLLFTRLKFQAALSLSSFLDSLIKNPTKLPYRVQIESDATYAPVIKKEDGHLAFAKQTAAEILNRMRAYQPWPSAYCFLNGKRMKILKAEETQHIPAVSYKKLRPGEVDTSLGYLLVGCLEGALRLYSVQLEGKKACSDEELLRGLRQTITLS